MKKERVRFGYLKTQNLKEFNRSEVQGWVIERFVDIERKIDKAIVDYFKPENDVQFENVVLNSSVLNIGSKLKILANINFPNATIQKIRQFSSIRNGFAHTQILDNFHIQVKQNKKVDLEGESIMMVMNSSGKINQKSTFEYLKEYNSLYIELTELFPK